MVFRPTLARLSPFERFLTLFTSVRPGEGASVFHLLVSGFVLMFSYYMLRPIREALVLSEFGAEVRAYSVGIVAVTLVFVIPLYKRLFDDLADHERKSRILRWVIAFFMSNLVIFVLLGKAGISIGVPYFIWLSIFNVMVVAQFWAFAADLFNTKSGQRLFPVIMVGLSTGALAGANTAEILFELTSPYLLMLVATMLLVIPLGLSITAERQVPDGSENHETEEREPLEVGFRSVIGGFDTVFKSRYLLLVAGLVFFINLINTTGEYIFTDLVKQWAVDAVAGNPSLDQTRLIGGIMANYYKWITLIGLLVQLFVVSRVFRAIGIRGAVLVLPVFMVLHYGILIVAPTFLLVRVLMVGEKGLTYSLQNTINHALYLPLSREQKYVGKTTIDTFVMRLGDLAQAGLVFVGLHILSLSTYGFIVVCALLSGVMLMIGLELRRAHKTIIKDKLSNLPPEVAAPLPDVYAPAGQLLMFTIPDECFLDPDPGDTLEYSATVEGGGVLPRWIRFDRYNQTFTVRAPRGRQGSLCIELTATDFEGLTVKGTFELRYGEGMTPRFSRKNQDDYSPT